MSTASLNIAVENLFATNWGSSTPVQFDNVPFETPNNPWVKVEVWDGKTRKASLGSGSQLRRSVGTVFVTINTPTGSGSKTAREYADQVCAIFRDAQISGITFEEPDVSRLGEVYHGATGGNTSGTSQWFILKVAIPYHYDFII